MDFKFTFKHLQALESIEDYAKHRSEKIAKFSMHKDIKAHFIFEATRGIQKAEILIDAGRFHLSAVAEESDLYTAIDKAIHRIETQMAKTKDKVQDHHHKQEHDLKEQSRDVEVPVLYEMAAAKKSN